MKYMVSVDGKSAPSKEHDTFSEAQNEAVRLSKTDPNAVIRVLHVVAVLRPCKQPTHAWDKPQEIFNPYQHRPLTAKESNDLCSQLFGGQIFDFSA